MKKDDLQQNVFEHSEGDQWFLRNFSHLTERKNDKFDWPIHLVKKIKEHELITSVLEIGCSNGWRLEELLKIVSRDARIEGIDISGKAIEDGKKRFPQINLQQAAISKIPHQGTFDLVIVNFVLHWVDRQLLATSLAEIDRVVADGGYLIIGDFLPNYSQRRRYHHYTDQEIYTYKQDYAQCFRSLGMYHELGRCVFNHDEKSSQIDDATSDSRAACVLLQKKLTEYYEDK